MLRTSFLAEVDAKDLCHPRCVQSLKVELEPRIIAPWLWGRGGRQEGQMRSGRAASLYDGMASMDGT